MIKLFLEWLSLKLSPYWEEYGDNFKKWSYRIYFGFILSYAMLSLLVGIVNPVLDSDSAIIGYIRDYILPYGKWVIAIPLFIAIIYYAYYYLSGQYQEFKSFADSSRKVKNENKVKNDERKSKHEPDLDQTESADKFQKYTDEAIDLEKMYTDAYRRGYRKSLNATINHRSGVNLDNLKPKEPKSKDVYRNFGMLEGMHAPPGIDSLKDDADLEVKEPDPLPYMGESESIKLIVDAVWDEMESELIAPKNTEETIEPVSEVTEPLEPSEAEETIEPSEGSKLLSDLTKNIGEIKNNLSLDESLYQKDENGDLFIIDNSDQTQDKA